LVKALEGHGYPKSGFPMTSIVAVLRNDVLHCDVL